MSTKNKRIFYLLLYVFFACVLILIIKPYYFFSILIVLVPPSLVNFIWLKHSRRKVLLFSFLSAILFAPPVELMTRLADVWDVQSIFPRPFGLIPIENMVFAFLNIFWGLCFYEHFVDRDRTKKISKKFKVLVGLYCLFASIIYGLYFYNKEIVRTNYFVISVLILIIPSLIIFGRKPALLKKTFLPTIFFAVIFFVYEMVSLHIGSWWWPGEYLYAFRVGGKVFPLDDIIIWYFLSTPALIGGYEFFADDWK